METYILLLILAGIVALDTTGGPQMLLSEPVVSCSLAGFLFGDPETGFMIGTFFQLIWFGFLPLGAVKIPDVNMGALIAVASLLGAMDTFGLAGDAAQAAILPALVWGWIAGSIGSRLQTAVRRNNSRLSEHITGRIERGEDVSVAPWHLLGMATSFTRGIAMTAVLAPAGAVLCGLTIHAMSGMTKGLAVSVPMLWGTACASAAIVSLLKGRTKPLVIGALAGTLWIVTVIMRSA